MLIYLVSMQVAVSVHILTIFHRAHGRWEVRWNVSYGTLEIAHGTYSIVLISLEVKLNRVISYIQKCSRSGLRIY